MLVPVTFTSLNFHMPFHFSTSKGVVHASSIILMISNLIHTSTMFIGRNVSAVRIISQSD